MFINSPQVSHELPLTLVEGIGEDILANPIVTKGYIYPVRSGQFYGQLLETLYIIKTMRSQKLLQG